MDGIININKPSGITSFDVIRKLRKILKIKKIGHTGTLDPLASGVLVVCVGKATKLVQDIEKLEKEYIAEFQLGYSTDTYDSEGKIIDSVKNFSVSSEKLEECLKKFLGNIKQIPPMYSAIKINGEKLYDLARKGETIEREARDITIYDLSLLKFNGKKAKIYCKVSKGTYIRSLIYDIGIDLKTFATMTSLERISVGSENIENSFTLEKIESLYSNKDCSFIRTVEEYFKYPSLTISTEKNKTLFLNGNTLVVNNTNDGFYKIYFEGTDEFLGLAYVSSNRLKGYKYY
ncbi:MULTISPECIES: tRNA pseudouridine(55) synthase TruB [Fusobacterium]|uniref:tRNA pseudouridine(55) synthase TruB n=1 Tax=Fusobacterium TaxID=848 RepID=UPI001476C0E7|nr:MULTISPECIES: tRNA pseudouridine(55) synthase TruB [Fusobacterium]NME36493.1 tRNA pseudouridine(55) synthase TruB [Fusobacterium sp. FSA-380-WT-3A]